MILTSVVGARPQFVKAAVVSRLMRSRDGLENYTIHTGQHFDANMSAVFFEELGMGTPNVNLEIGSGSHGRQTGRMLEAVEASLRARRPDAVIVYGDTNSTLAGALAAAKLQIPVAHVEAGLRSYNRRMPEEINRVLTDHASDVLFAPSESARQTLLGEGIDDGRIVVVGDVMYDSSLFLRTRSAGGPTVSNFGIREGNYVLATIHRAENTESPDRLLAIFSGLAKVAETMPVLLPLHPRTRAALAAADLLDRFSLSLRFVEPIGYLQMAALTANAAVVATDSGGLQKEAFFHRVPCVTIRTETEWKELVQLGWNRLASPDDCDAVVEAVRAATGSSGQSGEPFGDGHAGERILEVMIDRFGSRPRSSARDGGAGV